MEEIHRSCACIFDENKKLSPMTREKRDIRP